LDSHCHTNVSLSRHKLWLPAPCRVKAINISVDCEGHEEHDAVLELRVCGLHPSSNIQNGAQLFKIRPACFLSCKIHSI